MRNSCNQISTLLNTAEIVGNNNRLKLSPLLWSRFGCTCLTMFKNSLITTTLIFLISCSDGLQEDFIVVTNEEVGLVDQKIYMTDLVNIVSKENNLPVVMDSTTQWVSFTKGQKPKSVVYDFLLTKRDIEDYSETDIENHKNIQFKSIENDYCTNPQYTFIREHDISSEYRYSDKNYKYLFSIFSNELSCDK